MGLGQFCAYLRKFLMRRWRSRGDFNLLLNWVLSANKRGFFVQAVDLSPVEGAVYSKGTTFMISIHAY